MRHAGIVSMLTQALIMASATPRLPLDHATALQPRQHSVGEDADVRLRGHTWPRRPAQPRIFSLDSHKRGAL